MKIRKTVVSDIDAVMSLFDKARKTMAELRIDQWQDGYPFKEDILQDIEREESYVLTDNEEIIGTFMLMKRKEPTYEKIYDGAWLTPDFSPYATVHRVTVAPEKRASFAGVGASKYIVDYIKEYAAKENLSGGIKIDTHRGNVAMRKMLEKNGFKYCGVIYLADGNERVAYQFV